MAGSIYKIYDNTVGTTIAVGANGLILVSTDGGATWVTASSPTTKDLYGVAYGELLGVPGWVIVGQDGTILTSADAITWAIRISFTASDLYDVGFGGVFLAVGAGGAFGLSEDLGVNWEAKPSNTTEDLLRITVDLGAYLIVGTNDTIIVGDLNSLNFDILIEEGITVSDVVVNQGDLQNTIVENMEIVTEEFWIHDALGGGTLTQGGANQFVYVTENISMLEVSEDPTGIYQEESAEEVTVFDTVVVEHIRTVRAEVSWPMFAVRGVVDSGGALVANILWPLFKIEAKLSKDISADISWPMFTVDGRIDFPGDISGSVFWPMFTTEGVIAAEEILAAVTDLAVWVLNLESQHHSTYSNWQANSLVTFNGESVSSMPGGIFKVEGNQDEGGPIESKIYWPPSDFGVTVQKRLQDLYVRMRGVSANLQLVIKYDETEIRIFPFDISNDTNGNYVKRIKAPKGRQGNVIQIGLESVGECGLDFFELEASTVELKRRIR